MKEKTGSRRDRYPKIGTARRAVPNLHGRGAQASRLCMSESEATSSTGLVLHCRTRPRRPCPILKQQVRLQPMRFATPAWQATVKSGTPAASGSSPTPRRARHPYPFLSKGAAAPLAPSATPIVSFPSFDSLAPARSPFGPTYGCSISCLPRRSIVHSVCSVVKFFPFTLPPHFPAELPQAIESMKQKFDNRSRCGGLTDPEKEHPFDDFGFHFSPVLFCHQSFCEVFFLLVKSEFQACGNSSGFWGLNIRGFQNTKNLCGAHGKKFSKCLIPFVASVHSNLLNHLSISPSPLPLSFHLINPTQHSL